MRKIHDYLEKRTVFIGISHDIQKDLTKFSLTLVMNETKEELKQLSSVSTISIIQDDDVDVPGKC
jgi:hypothetical protein